MNDRNAPGGPNSSMGPRSGSELSGIARQANEGGPAHYEADVDGSLTSTLASLGIVAVPSTMFEWGGYRYTNSHDAIAAAQRAAR
jgi:hypothetical protein